MKLKLSACLLLILPVAAHAGGSKRPPALPKTLGYSFYVNGAPAGRSDIKITQTSKELIFESQTRSLTGVDVIALTCRTVADPKTYAVRDFSYRGTKGEHEVACQAQVSGDSVYGFIETDGVMTDKLLKMVHPQTVLFEDWVMEHEILLALTQAASPQKTAKYGIVFTAGLSPAEVTMGFSGEVLVEAGARSMTARKLVVIIQGADPFESHVDPVRGVPVYIRFHTARAEAFLDEVFGENPVTYFSATEKKP